MKAGALGGRRKLGSLSQAGGVNHRFTTAMVKGECNQWAICGGDAQSNQEWNLG